MEQVMQSYRHLIFFVNYTGPGHYLSIPLEDPFRDLNF